MLFAAPAYAGLVNRDTKAGTGTSAFGDATTITASELNKDADTLYTLVNGNIDTANISSSAAITLSQLSITGAITNTHIDAAGTANIHPGKLDQTAADGTDAATSGLDADIVDDYSATEPEQATVSDPGTSENTALATNLQTEIAQIRYKIEQLTVGRSATLVSSGDGTDTDASWIDGPYRPGNLIYNGSFDSLNTLAVGAAGDGWDLVKTPTTLAAIPLVESEGGGDGNALQIIDTGDANSGVSQTLNGLKADTEYLLIARVQDDGGTCSVGTTGADTTEITLVSDDGGTWQILSGTFQTDSTPANITISLLAVTQTTSDCSFLFVGVYEISDDPLPKGSDIVVQVASTDTTVLASAGALVPILATGGGSDLSVAVTPSVPGTIIEVVGVLVSTAGTNSDATSTIQIDESGVNVGPIIGIWTTESAMVVSTAVHHVNDSPTAGTTYTYKLDAETSADGDTTQGGALNSDTLSSYIQVRMTVPK